MSKIYTHCSCLFLSLLFLWCLSSCTTQGKYHDLEVHDHKLQDSLVLMRDLNMRLQTYIDDHYHKISGRKTSAANARRVSNRKSLSSTDITKMKKTNTKFQSELARMQKLLDTREKLILELQQTPEERRAPLYMLNDRLAKDLNQFKKQGLSLEVKNDRIYVTASNDLLFKSGSAKISFDGKNALATVALGLQEQENYHILVEGHTDDIPVSNLGHIKDNWDLSATRAISVARELVADGVDATIVSAVARGEHIPIGNNDSETGRKKNRRIEIILIPDFN